MPSHDPISDMLTRIRNAQQANLAYTSCPASKQLQSILEVLKREGYIRGYSLNEAGSGKKDLRIDLKYHDGEAVIRTLKRVSKPGRRVYSSIKVLQKVHNGLGIAILSTPRGVMSDHEARIENVGGEVLCNVF